MIHEALPALTETAFGSHPRCVVSVTYVRTPDFHGANEGSNPSGDANYFSQLQLLLDVTLLRHRRLRAIRNPHPGSKGLIYVPVV
jgi:hypothetical protein